MPFFAGKNATLSIGGVAYPMDSWSIAIETEEVEVTNFQSGGQKSIIAGIQGGTVSASGPYNGTAPSSGALANFTFGVAGGVNIGPYQVLITGVTVDTTVKEKATIEVTGSLAANLG
jgi:hypothetical protein